MQEARGFLLTPNTSCVCGLLQMFGSKCFTGVPQRLWCLAVSCEG